MNAVLQDFDTRVLEVEAYFRFVEALEARPELLKPTGPDDELLQDFDCEALLKTLKANGFLILYNLVESTTKNAIEAVFDEFRSKNVEFDHCRAGVQEIVIRNLKAHSLKGQDPGDVASTASPFAQRVLTETFRKDKVFSGNVDAKKIREVAKDYGFATPHAKGDNLLTVKSYRNDLAHGDKAFAEVGRDFDAQRMTGIKEEVRIYLAELLQHVSTYLKTRAYLVSATPAAATAPAP